MHMSTYACHTHVVAYWRTKEGLALWSWGSRLLQASQCESGEPKLGPLPEQQTLVSSEPCLRFPHVLVLVGLRETAVRSTCPKFSLSRDASLTVSSGTFLQALKLQVLMTFFFPVAYCIFSSLVSK